MSNFNGLPSINQKPKGFNKVVPSDKDSMASDP